MVLLDFEKPIAELEQKLQDMKQLADDSDESGCLTKFRGISNG